MEVTEVPLAKRPRQAYHHHHRLHHKQQSTGTNEPAFAEQHHVDTLLKGAIATICSEQALQKNLPSPEIGPQALDSFQIAVEEFILRLCSKIRRSMVAARRTVPIPMDFDSAFLALDVPRPDDQLPAYQTKTRINPSLYPTPPPDDAFHNHVDLPTEFLGPELGQQTALEKFSFQMSALPPLPSAHTYKDTAVFTEREVETRRIRELATEEGKLGEQALRKLAGAVKLETALATQSGVREQETKISTRKGRRVVAISDEAVFEETMRELLKAEPEDFELGPIVTAEKAFRMPDDAQVKRRLVASSHEDAKDSRPPDSHHSTNTRGPSAQPERADDINMEL